MNLSNVNDECNNLNKEQYETIIKFPHLLKLHKLHFLKGFAISITHIYFICTIQLLRVFVASLNGNDF